MDRIGPLTPGAIIGILGGSTGAIVGVFHPFESLSGDSTAQHMVEMAESDRWMLVHIGIALTTAMMLCGLGTIALAHRFSPGRFWAALGFPLAIAAASLSFVAMSIDGFAMKTIAERFVEANAQPGSPLYITTQGFEDIQLALFGMVALLSFGLPQLLFGIAVVRGDLLPHWLGGIAVLAGATASAVGTIQLISGPSDFTITAFIVCSVVYPLWIGTSSFIIWRKAKNPAWGTVAMTGAAA